MGVRHLPGGLVVLGRNWAKTFYKYDLHYSDVVEFKL
jgi:hypothetical protein